jgi:D-lactate dehydrogenase
MYKLAWLIHKLTNRKIPLWNPAMPHAAIPVHKIQWATKAPTKPKVVYWPTCTTQIFGPATGSDARDTKLAAISLLHKSNFVVIIPDTVTALCCGQPLDSEGNFAQANLKRDEVLAALKHASNNFTYPIVTDASPCALRINNNSNQVKIYDSVEFIYKYCLPQLKITKMPGKLAVHQTCSTRRANNGQYLLAIARTLADEIVIPESVSCCGFAGDKGFSLPELNAAALKDLKTEVSGCSCGISTSRTCEIGLAHYSGLTYYSVFDLLDRQSIHLVTN